MSANLLDSLKGYITPELISQASSALGESEGGISKAVSAALPTLLSGLVNKSGDSGAMGSIMDLVKQSASGDGSDGILSNLGGLLSGGSSASSGIGSTLLSMLFGGKLNGITDLISSVSGVKGSTASSLLGMAAPMLLGHLGKSGTSLSGLTDMLSSQKSSILAAAPAGLSSLMDSGSSKASYSSGDSGNSGGGLPKWLMPLLLAIGALALLYFLSKRCTKADGDTDVNIENVDSLAVDADTISRSVGDAVDSTATAVSDAASAVTTKLGAFFTMKLPNGTELNAPKNGIENQIVNWMSDKTKVVDKTTWFNFDRLLFETGKSTLKPESQEQLKNIAEVMKAYPTMAVKLGGYTDNVGNPQSNLKLSGDRAKTVMGELVKLGIEGSRVASEGYGDQFPVASNDTEEGRAQNRRIAVRVTKK